MSHRLTESEYNYDSFVPAKFGPLMRFSESPPVGQTGPDFALWRSDTRDEIRLSDLWKAHSLLIVEFGSFT